LTVTAADANRVYGQANPVFTGTIVGLVIGDNISANYVCAATPTSLPGSYPIVPGLVDPNDRQTNYLVSLVNGALTVTPAAPPTVVTVSPNTGPTNGGTTVTILGTGFQDGATVNFGALPAATLNFISPTNLTAVTLPSWPGTVDVVLTNADGQSVIFTNGFTYVAPPVISAVAQTAGTITFTWSATAGQRYQVQSNTNLTQTNWSNLGSALTATNASATTTDTMDSAQRFYRVLLLP
jgi:hypothetical protein